MIGDKVIKRQDRLADTFSAPSQIIEESLLPPFDSDLSYEQTFVEKFRGQDIALNSFQDFYFDTLKLVANLSQREKSISSTLAFKIAIHMVSYRRFRASHILFLKGYPFDATSLLGCLFESVLDIAALEHNIVSLEDLYVPFPNKELFILSKRKNIKDHSNTIQSKINSTLIGNNSGLSPKTIEEIEVWRFLLHNTVHKSFLAMSLQRGQWLHGKSCISLLQEIDDKQAAFYMNRSSEIAWMLLRTLPLLQAQPMEFGDGWDHKWKVLDISFREMFQGVQKNIASAICEFIDKKLNFNQVLI